MELDFTENPEWVAFIQPDTPSNTLINASGVIIGQTFLKIIETLTHPLNPDTNALPPLLATLDNWTTPEKFLDALLMRFNIPPPKDKSDESIKKYKEELQVWDPSSFLFSFFLSLSYLLPLPPPFSFQPSFFKNFRRV
jgi:hypothetical protein